MSPHNNRYVHSVVVTIVITVIVTSDRTLNYYKPQVVGVSMLLGNPNWTGPPPKPLVMLNWTAASLGTQFFKLAWDPIPQKSAERESGFMELPHRLSAT